MAKEVCDIRVIDGTCSIVTVLGEITLRVQVRPETAQRSQNCRRRGASPQAQTVNFNFPDGTFLFYLFILFNQETPHFFSKGT